MTNTTKKFIQWLMSLTVLLRCFVIALLFHVAILLVIGSIKIAGAIPEIVAAFGDAPPPTPLEEEPDPMAAYRDVDYQAPGVSGPQAPVEYKVAIAEAPKSATDSQVAEVIGVMSDSVTAVARLQGTAGALTAPTFAGGGDNKIGIVGIATAGSGHWTGRLGPARAINAAKHGASARTEAAVMAALRWFKANQNSDGSWAAGANRDALTALAVLCFLGRGETTESKEFGDAVSRGIQFLVASIDSNGVVPARGSYMYTQGAVTLALSEAYGMTQAKAIRDPLERSIKAILAAQKVNKMGAWRYTMTAPNADTSVSAWLIMSLKSAKLAGIDVPEDSFKLASNYLWTVYDDDGGFGYTAPSRRVNMTGAGVLCQQFLGQSTDPRIKKALDYLKQQKVDWDETAGAHVLYGWYYVTQAMFQGGGSYWEYWNKQIRDAVVNKQAPDGHWASPTKSKEDSNGPVYTTALACLILEVYYRYMPIHQEMERNALSAATAPETK